MTISETELRACLNNSFNMRADIYNLSLLPLPNTPVPCLDIQQHRHPTGPDSQGIHKGRLQFVLDITYYLTVEEVDRALGAGSVLLGVGYHHDGGSLGIQFLQQVHDLLAVLGVEVTGRLIGEDQLRTGHYGAGDGDALLLTAGESP